jgi:hypothetical protein
VGYGGEGVEVFALPGSPPDGRGYSASEDGEHDDQADGGRSIAVTRRSAAPQGVWLIVEAVVALRRIGADVSDRETRGGIYVAI